MHASRTRPPKYKEKYADNDVELYLMKYTTDVIYFARLLPFSHYNHKRVEVYKHFNT